MYIIGTVDEKKKVKNIFTRIEIANPRQNPAIKNEILSYWTNNEGDIEK